MFKKARNAVTIPAGGAASKEFFMIVYFDTVKRKRPVEDGGELVKLDWSTKKVVKSLPLYPTEPDIEEDPNPRGNSRGGKGMLISGDEVFVGTYHTILVYDLELNLKRRISNNLFVNIHEMCFAGRDIWVSSTTIDSAVLVDPQEKDLSKHLKTWWPREEPLIQARFRVQPLEIDKTVDNRLLHLHKEISSDDDHTHLNSVTKFADNTYVLLNKMGAFIQIEPELEFIFEDELLRGGHSPVVTGDGKQFLVCSNFRKKSVLIFDLENRQFNKRIDLLDFAEVAELHEKHPDQPFNKSIFPRGLEILDEERILVGISPASILEIDIKREKLLDFYQHSFDVGDAVHGLVHVKRP